MEGFAIGDLTPNQPSARKLAYYKFLESDYWKDVSYRVKQRARFRCELCVSTISLQVHHKTYEHHGMEAYHLEDLICLCGDCHRRFHDKLASGDPENNVLVMPRLICAPEDEPVRTEELQAALNLLVSYANEAGGLLQKAKCVRRRLREDLGITPKRAGVICRILHDREFIIDRSGDKLRLRTKGRWMNV